MIESETEPEEDDPTIIALLAKQAQQNENGGMKRKTSPAPEQHPAKKLRFQDPESDDSVTEPESDDSVTESESEDEMLFTVGDFLIPGINTPHSRGQSLHPRPAFARKPSQRWLLPFYLDKENHIRVPGSINTFLRDYQRDGVRFFWERYNTGRGGLLGDDMGLVRCSSKSSALY